nr:secreted RxLR effector protein 161-like [Nicotiana tomentosiformis]
MGEAAYILGVKISRDCPKKLLYLSQENYIRKVLERFNMQDSSPVETPISKGHTLGSQMCPKTPEETERMSRVPYRSIIGSLMYAMVCTRPDICQAVGLVSRYQTDSGLAHWQAVKRIMRYLNGTADYALCYQGGKDLRLVGYSDANQGGDLDEKKSTSGCVFLLSDGAISWSIKILLSLMITMASSSRNPSSLKSKVKVDDVAPLTVSTIIPRNLVTTKNFEEKYPSANPRRWVVGVYPSSIHPSSIPAVPLP